VIGERAARCLLLVGIALSACATSDAQTGTAEPPASAKSGSAPVFDSYGSVGWEDQQARLDNFALELQNNPLARGYIIIYGGRKDFSKVAEIWADRDADYLTSTRGIDASRITSVSGGLKDQDDMEFDLWVLPPDAPAPEPKPTLSEDKRKPPTGKFVEYETDEAIFYGCEDGPCVDRTGIDLAGWLERGPTLLAYVVVYTSKTSTPGAANMIGKREQHSLLQQSRLDAVRVKVIHAGEAENTKVELWLLSKDSPPPASEAKTVGLPGESFKVGELSSYDLADADRAGLLRESVADLLREHADARVYLIVHPPDQQEVNEEAAREAERVANCEAPLEVETLEPQRAAEQWRKELIDKYKIDGGRIEVVTGRIEEGSDGTLAAWVVPAGASPPDPFAMPDDSVDNQAGDEPQGAITKPPSVRL
jgi:hypothetical protein